MDEKYNLYIDGGIGRSIISGATIEVFNNFMYLVRSLISLIVLDYLLLSLIITHFDVDGNRSEVKFYPRF